MQFVLLMMLLLSASADTEPPKLAVHNFTKKIAERMFDCADLMFPGFDFTEEILDFWKKDYNVRNINVGCLAMCSVFKLSLLDKNGELHEPNFRGFLSANGADENLVSRIVDMYQKCHEATELITKTCTKGLELMKCFRVNIYQLQWVPEVQFGPYD